MISTSSSCVVAAGVHLITSVYSCHYCMGVTWKWYSSSFRLIVNWRSNVVSECDMLEGRSLGFDAELIRGVAVMLGTGQG